ncbi:MAG: cytochrome c maturation protein CcmE [Maricaulaceae bacterium]
MAPKRRNQRLALIGLGALAVVAAAGLALSALSENIALFYSPSELAEAELAPGRTFRLGGMVEEGSVRRDGLDAIFEVTDFVDAVEVRYTGVLPDLFREGQGVVAQGALSEEGVFLASTVLAKHDEKYVPPEVKEALDRAQTAGS